MPIVIDQMALKDILGPPLFDMEVSRRGDHQQGFPISLCRLYNIVIHMLMCIVFFFLSALCPCCPSSLSSATHQQQIGEPSCLCITCVDNFSVTVRKVSERLTLPGVAVGLAWTPLGGEIMFVEASRMEGDGQLTLTGQLGDVMKESAHLAISWLRTNAKQFDFTNSKLICFIVKVVSRTL